MKSLILPLPGGQSRCKVVTSDQDGQAFWELRYLLHNLGLRMDCWRWTRPDHSTPAHRTAPTLTPPGLDPHAYMRWLHQKQQRGGIASLAHSCQLDPRGLRRSRKHEAQKLLTGAGSSLVEVERAPKAGLCRLSTVAYLPGDRIADSGGASGGWVSLWSRAATLWIESLPASVRNSLAQPCLGGRFSIYGLGPGDAW